MIVRRLLLAIILMTAAQAASAECNPSLRPDTPTERFVPQESGLLVDRATGLVWQRCPLGFQWHDGACQRDAQDLADGVDWGRALRAAQAQSGAQSAWRLPNIKELDSIVDRSCVAPAVNRELFPGTPAALFWTSSPNTIRPDVAYVIDFDKGGLRSLNKAEPALVRLVRDYNAPAQ